MPATLLPILSYEVGLGYERTSDWQIFTKAGGRKYLNAAERLRFLDAANEQSPERRALCFYLMFSGTRISEALALRAEHIDATTNRVVVRTLKRRKLTFRQIPLPDFVVEMLMSVAPTEGPLWTIHRSGAWRWVTEIMEAAAIRGPMACCRGTRHGFAMHAASRSVPGNLLQRWCGHASFGTTAVYLDAIGEDERAFAERMW